MRPRARWKILAFPAGVQQPDRARSAVGQPDRAAIGHMNDQHHARLSGHQSIHAGDDRQAIRRHDLWRARDHRHFRTVHLLGTPENRAVSGKTPDFRLMMGPQLPHRLVTIARDLQTRDPLHPAGPHTGNRRQGSQK
jgi:hypothetical protein